MPSAPSGARLPAFIHPPPRARDLNTLRHCASSPTQAGNRACASRRRAGRFWKSFSQKQPTTWRTGSSGRLGKTPALANRSAQPPAPGWGGGAVLAGRARQGRPLRGRDVSFVVLLGLQGSTVPLGLQQQGRGAGRGARAVLLETPSPRCHSGLPPGRKRAIGAAGASATGLARSLTGALGERPGRSVFSPCPTLCGSMAPAGPGESSALP